jgi:hypothetical protein
LVLAHSLLGDPSFVGEGAPKANRDLYYELLDKHCAEQLDRCKVWLGGTRYDEAKLRCVYMYR